MPCYSSWFKGTPEFWQPLVNGEQKQGDDPGPVTPVSPHGASAQLIQTAHPKRTRPTQDTYTLLSVIDMESSVRASLDISLSFALVAGAKT